MFKYEDLKPQHQKKHIMQKCIIGMRLVEHWPTKREQIGSL